MRAAGPLMLLLCLSLIWGDAHGDADTPQRVQVDVWAELRALRDMVVEQRVELRLMGDRVRESERQLDQLKRENTALETRMAASEKEVEGLRAKVTGTQSRPSAIERTGQQAPDTKCSALEAKLSAIDRRLELLEGEQVSLSTRLTSSESQAEQLSTRLTSSESRAEQLSTRLTSSESRAEQLSTRLTSSESRAEAAEKAAADRPKVAFSASLGSAMGPVDADTVIVYDRVLTNVGHAYSATSGAFTAPVKGVYRVSFTGADGRPKAWLSVHLFKNGQRAMLRGSYNNGGENGGDNKYVSVSLVLEHRLSRTHRLSGDQNRLSRTHRLSGDQNRHTTFDGFLLFPL